MSDVMRRPGETHDEWWRRIHPVKKPRARRTDPATSHQAAAGANNGLTIKQTDVLKVIRRTGAAHDQHWMREYRLSDDVASQSLSGLRTRRSELVEMGLVRDTGTKARTDEGYPTIVWEAT